MIAPASLGDWVMFGGLLGSLGAAAALGYRFVLAEEREEPAAPAHRPRSVPILAEALPARASYRGERVGVR